MLKWCLLAISLLMINTGCTTCCAPVKAPKNAINVINQSLLFPELEAMARDSLRHAPITQEALSVELNVTLRKPYVLDELIWLEGELQMKLLNQQKKSLGLKRWPLKASAEDRTTIRSVFVNQIKTILETDANTTVDRLLKPL